MQKRSHGHGLRILTRYVLWEILVPATLALLVILFLGVVHEMRERQKALPLAQIEFADVARLAVYFMPTLISYVVPIAYMLGILLAFGRLAQNNEITAMRAAGISLKRISLPVIVVGGLLSVGSFLLQDQVQPAALKRANRLIFEELPTRLSLTDLLPGVMHTYGDWRVYIGHKDPETGTLYDVEIVKAGEDNTEAYHAKSAHVETGGGQSVLIMKDAHAFHPGDDRVMPCARFPELDLPIAALPTNKIPSLRRTLNLRQLFAQERLLRFAVAMRNHALWNEEVIEEVVFHTGKVRDCPAIPQDVKESFKRRLRLDLGQIDWLRQIRGPELENELRKARTEITDRLSLPLACLAVSFAAAPLGIRARHSARSRSFAVGFTLCIAYYLMWSLLPPSSLCTLRETLLRGLTPNFVFALAGALFLWRVDRV